MESKDNNKAPCVRKEYQKRISSIKSELTSFEDELSRLLLLCWWVFNCCSESRSMYIRNFNPSPYVYWKCIL